MEKCKRKITRQNWSEETMKNAIATVVNNEMGYKKASIAFNVPFTTLKTKVQKFKKQNLSIEKAAKKTMGGVKPTFNEEQENELVNYIFKKVKGLYGLTIIDICALAFEFADNNMLPNNFNKNTKLAGIGWVSGFLKRHPQLSITYKKVSISNFQKLNKITVVKFFTLLNNLNNKYNFLPEKIFNVGEIGISIYPKKNSKVVNRYRKKPFVERERRDVTTIIMCMNAAGNFMPPHFIIPRQIQKFGILDDTLPGSTVSFHKSGQIKTHIFNYWFDLFLSFSKPTENKPVLLLLDRHVSHIKNQELIEKARNNYVHLLCFPPHTMHRLQPLDISLMDPISTYYSEEVSRWNDYHPGRVLTTDQIPKLLKPVFLKACTKQTAVIGFEKTGIYPLNSNIFPDWMFAPEETTNITDNHNSDEQLSQDKNTLPLHFDMTDKKDITNNNYSDEQFFQDKNTLPLNFEITNITDNYNTDEKSFQDENPSPLYLETEIEFHQYNYEYY